MLTLTMKYMRAVIYVVAHVCYYQMVGGLIKIMCFAFNFWVKMKLLKISSWIHF